MPWMAVAGVIAGAVGAAGSIASAAIGQQHTKYTDPTEGANKWRYSKDQDMWNKGEDYQNQAETNYRDAKQSREGLSRAAAMTEAAARGEGTSVAAAQLKRGMDQSVNEAANTAAGAQGDVGLGLANAQQQNQQSAMMRGTNQDAAVLRAQEIAAARGQLGDLYGGMRQGDLATAGMRIGQGQWYGGAAQQEGVNELDANRSWEQFKAGGRAQAQGMQAAQEQHNNDLWAKGFGGAASAIGSGISNGMNMQMYQDRFGGGGGGGADYDPFKDRSRY